MNQEYLTKEVAEKRSGRSVRRLLELAARGLIRKKIIRDPKNANRELALFHARDIALLKLGMLDQVQPPAPKQLQVAAPVRQAATAPPAPAAPRLWLTIAEAAEYSGLPASFLIRLIGGGKLAALDVGNRKGGRWRIAKRDLEAIKGDRAK